MSVGCATGVAHDSQPCWLQGLLRIAWSFCLKKLPACLSAVPTCHLCGDVFPFEAPIAGAPHVAANKAPLPLSDGKHILQAGTAGVSLLMATSQRLCPDTQVSVEMPVVIHD